MARRPSWDSPLLTSADVKTLLGAKSVAAVNRLVREENLPFVMVGTRRRYVKREIEAWLENRRRRDDPE